MREEVLKGCQNHLANRALLIKIKYNKTLLLVSV